MTFKNAIKIKLVALATGAGVALSGAVPAEAIVPPKRCGIIKAKGKRWEIIGEGVPCDRAKRWSATYIRTYDAPRGYRCKRGPSGSKLWRTCYRTRGEQVQFKIIKK